MTTTVRSVNGINNGFVRMAGELDTNELPPITTQTWEPRTNENDNHVDNDNSVKPRSSCFSLLSALSLWSMPCFPNTVQVHASFCMDRTSYGGGDSGILHGSTTTDNSFWQRQVDCHDKA